MAILNSSSVETLPIIADIQKGYGDWIVMVFDNDVNSVDEVVQILITATKCGVDEAVMETWEIHHLGKSVVHHGMESVCHEVGAIIASIGIKVEVRQE